MVDIGQTGALHRGFRKGFLWNGGPDAVLGRKKYFRPKNLGRRAIDWNSKKCFIPLFTNHPKAMMDISRTIVDDIIVWAFSELRKQENVERRKLLDLPLQWTNKILQKLLYIELRHCKAQLPEYSIESYAVLQVVLCRSGKEDRIFIFPGHHGTVIYGPDANKV